MSVRYIETYLTPSGDRYGIEDYNDGAGDEHHFFPDQYRSGQRPQFGCWVNGCGIGGAPNVEGARGIIRRRITERAAHDVEAHTRLLCQARATWEAFEAPGSSLAEIKVPNK